VLDAMFEVLSAAEADRVRALYAPLADAVRELVDATIRTEVDDDVVADARSAIEAVTESLRQKTRPVGVSYRVDDRPLPLANAAIGVCNPIAPRSSSTTRAAVAAGASSSSGRPTRARPRWCTAG